MREQTSAALSVRRQTIRRRETRDISRTSSQIVKIVVRYSYPCATNSAVAPVTFKNRLDSRVRVCPFMTTPARDPSVAGGLDSAPVSLYHWPPCAKDVANFPCEVVG